MKSFKDIKKKIADKKFKNSKINLDQLKKDIEEKETTKIVNKCIV